MKAKDTLEIDLKSILGSSDIKLLHLSLLEKVDKSDWEKNKLYSLIKERLELLISKTPTGELRNELSEINILLHLI